MSCINNDELVRLFTHFARYPDTRDLTELLYIQSKCKEIFEKDYHVSIIPNQNGELCATYPLDLVILEGCKRHSPFFHSKVSSNSRKVNDSSKLHPLFIQGRFARVRARFPVPVILWNTKNICRSATLSHKFESVLQTAHNQVKAQLLSGNGVPAPDSLSNAQMENLRNRDILIIKQLSVKYILDLMMENKKKKFGFHVCSSEKVDMHDRYAPFVIASIPYPGVEFFQEFNQRKHCANDLRFDWDKPEDVVKLKVDHVVTQGQNSGQDSMILWEEYKTWDLVVLTQNYLKLMLQFIADGSPDTGILVHCISGWDRTPLFISLLRISMWADGEVHQSLTAEEILYLTVAYDWLLFGHQLSDRASRGEDIFYFCFYFLQFMQTSDFSILHQSNGKANGKPNGKANGYTNGNGTHSVPRPIQHPVTHSNSAPSTPVDVPPSRHHRRKLSEDDPSDLQFGSWQMMEALSLTDRLGPLPEEYSDLAVKAEFEQLEHSNHEISFESNGSIESMDSSHSSEETQERTDKEQEATATTGQTCECGPDCGSEPCVDRDPELRATKLTQLRNLSLSLYEQCCSRNNDQKKWMSNGIWRLLPRFV